MRIEGIHIDGFGHFHEQRINPLAPGMNVFFGPNEAGKSTLLAFIQAVLYGFPRQRRAEHYPPLAGGRHGGRLWLADERGGHYIVERRPAPAGKDITITLADGDESASEDVLRQLLGGASRDVFTSVFSFGIAELQAIESLSGGEIGAQIYSAGIGAGAVPAAVAALAREEEEIFRKRGQRHRVAAVLKELDEVEARLREGSHDDARFAALERDRARVARDLAERTAAHQGLVQASTRAQRLDDAWGVWSRLVRIVDELEALGPAAIAAGTVERMETLEEALRRAADDQVEAEEAHTEALAALQAVVVDQAVVAAADAIETLRVRRSAFEGSVRDLPKREAEAAAARKGIGDAIAELGPGWDLARAAQVDSSSTCRLAIGEWQERLHEAEVEARRRSDRLEHARERYDERRKAQRRASAMLVEAGAAPEVAAAGAQLAAVQACLDARAELPAEETGAAGGRFVTAVAGAGTAGLAAALLLGMVEALIASVAGAAAGFAWATWQKPSGRGTEAEALAEALRVAGVSEQALPAALRLAEEDLRRANARRALERELADNDESLAESEAALRGAADESERATAKLSELRGEWQVFASASGMGDGVSPALAVHLLGQAAVVRERAHVLADFEHRVAAIGRDIDQFVAAVGAAADVCGHPAVTGAESAAHVAGRLIEALDNARQASQSQREAAARVEACEGRMGTAAARLEQQELALAALLSSNGVEDAAALRDLAERSAARRALEAQRRECELRIADAGGAGEALARFKADLTATEPGLLAAQTVELKEQLDATARERDALLEERGAIERELAELRAGEGTSHLLLRREHLRTELQDLAGRWSELRLARRLIERTRAVYEAERQPRVVKAAESYFAAMTGGRYSQVIAPLGEQTVRVSDGLHAPRTPDQLSRGTREQLYLALRFGLIDQFAERGGTLPVAVDEVLVNFDPARAREAARGFARLGQRHQVIAFTCHPWVVELMQAAEPNARIWHLGSDGAAMREREPVAAARA
jgi:uncharacterized protein YhaN